MLVSCVLVYLSVKKLNQPNRWRRTTVINQLTAVKAVFFKKFETDALP